MLAWPETILNVNNQDDHELECDNIKHYQGLQITSQGRYTITLSRILKQSLSNDAVLQAIQEEYGIEQEEFQLKIFDPSYLSGPVGDLVPIFAASKVALSGSIPDFKQTHNIGQILGLRSIINDGNTIILHFWDNTHHYVLMHEIKYH